MSSLLFDSCEMILQITQEQNNTIMQAASAPKSLLARYRQLAPNASVRVSPLCLGAMTFGERGTTIQGRTTLEESTAILDAFYKAGGNFIGTRKES